MKMKLSGAGSQFKGVERPGSLLTLSIRRLYNVPDPLNGVLSVEKAETRRVLTGPAPGRMFAATFQLLVVSPAGSTNGDENVTASSSKVKSP